MVKTYNLDFAGYWRDKKKIGLPHVPGIYCVYKGNLQEDKTVALDKIVYIGEAEDINKRHNEKEHEHYKDFVRVCGGADHVWYSAAEVLGGEKERKRVENALIFRIQTEINDKGKDSFCYPETTMNSKGKHRYIPETFTVEETIK